MDKGKILIVDDMEINREVLGEILQVEYDILYAEDGNAAILALQENFDAISAVLLDLIMPGIDGYEVLKYMHDNFILDSVPVLVITGEESVKIEKKCFDLGASDFIRKPFDNKLVLRRVKNVTELYAYKHRLEEKVRVQTGALQMQYKLLQSQTEELKKNNQRIIDILGNVVECRNLESGEHVQRVREFTRIMAVSMMEDYPEYKLTPETIDVIVSASSLHDIGKIAIPDNILLKPGRLTKDEFEAMKTHTTRGCEIIRNIENAWGDEYSRYCYEICRHHHERYDGKGYPDGLSGDEIPISAQLVSIADVYDALVNVRCYKDSFSKEKAYEMIVDGECGTFSPKLLNTFKKMRDQFEMLADRFKNQSCGA